jgi:glycosyltransferase involved in cell wall biosynthesis
VPSSRIRVLFIIRELSAGGAERQLAALVRLLDRRRFEVAVATMYSGGKMWPEFEAIPDVTLVSLDKRGRWDTLGFLGRLRALTRRFRPHIVHGYMSGANELALLAAWLCGAKAVWGIRVSDQDFSRYSRFRRAVYRAGVHLSRLPDLIIANSYAGRAAHVAEGYPQRRFMVISNGIDVARFHPDGDAGARWRAAHGVAADEFLIGLPARLDPMKDHATFLRAAATLVAEVPGTPIRFVCVGDGPEAFAAELRALAHSLGVGDRVSWLPAQRDVVALYNAFDVVTSASAFGEGFPNVIGEAMACGIPCVAAPSGDAVMVIGDAGFVVPSRDPAALAEAWRRIVELPAAKRQALAARARQRMASEFTLQRLAERSAAAFTALTEGRIDEIIESAAAPAPAGRTPPLAAAAPRPH